MKPLILIVFSIIALVKCAFATPTQWQNIAPGLQYTKIIQSIGFPNGAIHAFRLNLKYYKLAIAFTHNDKQPLITVKDLVISKNALLGINGGFFNPTLIPLGLRIDQGRVINPVKRISWWGIFYIKNNKATIIPQKAYRQNSKISFAIQSGPRLIINGRIPSLKPGIANRSALGIDKAGYVIIAVTENLPLTTVNFAKLLKKPAKDGGLGCVNAMNLDGGSSSQLYAHINNFTVNIASFSPITDAVLVLPKKPGTL